MGVSSRIGQRVLFVIEHDTVDTVAVEKQRQHQTDGTTADDADRGRPYVIIHPHEPRAGQADFRVPILLLNSIVEKFGGNMRERPPGPESVASEFVGLIAI
jgi:hypothetical protein